MDRETRQNRFREGSGFIAALDQSGGSTPRALGLYGVGEDEYAGEDEMMALMHAMRVRIVSSPEFNGERIIGAILFERTMESEIGDQLSADYLWEQRGVLPFLKIDVGLEAQSGGISLMKPIPEIDRRLERASERNIFGTKMRSVIHEPNAEGVERIVAQQFVLADRILDHDLVPIIEPEVAIIATDKADCEDLLLAALRRHLDALPDGRDVAMKLTLPETPNHYAEVVAHPRVLRVTGLSGGYDRAEACRRLAANPGMIASFSRAFAEGLVKSMSDSEFNTALGASIAAIHRASCS